MKKLVKNGIPWLRLCYGIAVLVWLVFGLYRIVGDGMARSSGKLVTGEVELSAFTLVNMNQLDNDTLESVSDDPQMHLDTTGMAVRNLELHAIYSDEPREMCLYYCTRVGEDFSQDKRVYPKALGEGRYRFDLPYGTVTSIRLDPCSDDVMMYETEITLNTDQGLASYLLPTWYQLFCMGLYPALAAAVLSTLEQGVKKLREYIKK